VDWRATVFLDGEALGAHEGGYTHFTFDAGGLEPGSEHELAVEAFDPDDDAFGQPKGKQRGSHDIWYTRTYGPWRPIWIEGVPQDMPSSHDLSTAEARERFLREWLEIVAQLRAHPSVVLWIPINEDWGEPPPDFQRELVRATRAADPTRLVIDASGWNQLEDT